MINRHTSFGAAVLMGVALLAGAGPGRVANTVQAAGQENNRSPRPAPPVVFQAAGPTIASIQSMVDAFRAALGAVNNGNVAGPLAEGRREINWDGGGSTATSLVPTPFDGFLVTRGGRFITPGSGFVQAPVEGLVDVFKNHGTPRPFRRSARSGSSAPSTATSPTPGSSCREVACCRRRPQDSASSSPTSISSAAVSATGTSPGAR